jgi:hypothetical protein
MEPQTHEADAEITPHPRLHPHITVVIADTSYKSTRLDEAQWAR